MFLLCGEERASDSNKVIAQRAQSQGVQVVWEQYEAMPHMFMMTLEKTPHSGLCFKQWATFCRDSVEDPESIKTVDVK